MAEGQPCADARKYAVLMLMLAALAVGVFTQRTATVVLADPAPPGNSEPALQATGEASSVEQPGPKGTSSAESAIDAPTTNAIDAATAWHFPSMADPRGGSPTTPLYDNGAPLDDFNDPSSQASLQIDGATTFWRFIAAAADDFRLPDSVSNPGVNYRITTVRVAFDFFGSGSATANPQANWTQGVYVTIYANSPLNQPSGAPALSGGNVVFTGTVVHSLLVPQLSLTNQIEVNTGCRIVHQIDIPVDFVLSAETTYWISVMPRYPAPPQSAWCFANRTSGSTLPGHRGATFDLPFWTVVEGNSATASCSVGGTPGAYKELSFQLFGAEVSTDIGACCNTLTGACVDVDRVIDPVACTGVDESFNPGTLCDFLVPRCDQGACCYTDAFNVDQCILATQAQCNSLNSHAFRLGEVCSPAIDCTRPPVNNNCAQSLPIGGSVVVQPFNSANATTDPATPAPPGCGQIARDIWFNYSAGCDGTLVVTTIGSSFDTVIALYGNGSSTCPPCPTSNTDFLECNDDNPFDPGEDYAIIVRPVVVGECIKIRVGGKPDGSPDGGPGILRVFCVPQGQGACCNAVTGACTIEFEANCTPPARWFEGQPCESPLTCLHNDACTNPAPLPSITPLTQTFNTARATRTPGGQPTDCGSIEQDIWYAFVVPCTGDLKITTTGSSYDTFLAVYDFSDGIVCPDPTLCNDLTNREIACNDDFAPDDNLARVHLNGVSAGDCLIIRVGGHDDGFDNSGGPGVLNIYCIRPNEGACCSADGSTCNLVEDVDCLAPNTFRLGQICEIDTCPTTPENDLCLGAIALSGSPVSEAFETTLATTDPNAPITDCGAIVQDLWYQYVAPCTGTLIIDTLGSSFDTSIAVYGQNGVCPAECPLSSPDGDSSERVCSNDGVGIGSLSRVLVSATQGDCFLIRVGGNALSGDDSFGSGVLNIVCTTDTIGACCHADRTCDDTVLIDDCLAQGDQFFSGETCSEAICPSFPPNDECDGAITITDGQTPFDTTTASDSPAPIPPAPTCEQPTKDLWYRYVAPCTGVAHITVCGSVAFDTVIAVYDDCEACGDGQTLADCDNNGCGPNGASDLFLSVNEAQCYLIRIGGVAGASGTGVLSINCGPNTQCCPGDVNLNSVVDLIDVPIFVGILLDPIPPSDPAYCAANVNGDAAIDGRDIQTFIDVLLSGESCEILAQGACCNGPSCIETSQLACIASGGEYQGNLTECASGACSTLAFGACCLPNEVCTEFTLGTCTAQGGDFQGDGSVCTPATCTPPPPPVTCDFEFVAEVEATDPNFDAMGESASLSGSAFVAGARTRNSTSGSAFVFRDNGGVWTQESELTAFDATDGASFGKSVAIDGDRIIVGAPVAQASGTPVGAVYEFTRVGGVWIPGAKYLASTSQASQLFGQSVSLDGNTLFVGAMQDNTGATGAGAAYVFEYDGATWHETQKLTPSDPSPSALFGSSVVVRGDLAVVGARLARTGLVLHGAAYIYERVGGVWTFSQKLTASDQVNNSFFGWSVDISGETIVVGAYQTFSGGFQSGAAYVFERSGGTWQQSQKLAPATPVGGANFGSAVRMIGSSIAIGARGENAVYLFVRQDGSWQQRERITSPGAETGDRLGSSVDWNGTTLIAGAEFGEVSATNTGTVHIFDLACNGACCIGGSCSMLLAADCAAAGGTFQGVGVQCASQLCGQAPGCCVGDFTSNGQVDLGDVAPFVNAVLTPPDSGPAVCRADANIDGTVDGRDISAFMSAVLNVQSCPP
ncbi:MAG: hypothetical protein KF841_13295 [Phycisphaerae bacterium]|nr:hypothetical protein [Phycisphaerae bacterium]